MPVGHNGSPLWRRGPPGIHEQNTRGVIWWPRDSTAPEPEICLDFEVKKLRASALAVAYQTEGLHCTLWRRNRHSTQRRQSSPRRMLMPNGRATLPHRNKWFRETSGAASPHDQSLELPISSGARRRHTALLLRNSCTRKPDLEAQPMPACDSALYKAGERRGAPRVEFQMKKTRRARLSERSRARAGSLSKTGLRKQTEIFSPNHVRGVMQELCKGLATN